MNKVKYLILLIFISCISLINGQNLTFAVIGDYGDGSDEEEDVANLVKSWNPEFIVTVGDNNYENGSASTIDDNIGQFYHEFIHPYLGSYGNGSPDSNRFFPVPGNHDWRASNLTPYRDYFTLPHNERYYDFVWENVHFFMIDSDPNEPDGYSQSSVQGEWFEDKIIASTAEWKIAVLHFSPYCSGGDHGSISTVQWDYKQWEIDAVFSGHDHIYERLIVDDLDYWVNGLGGKNIDSLETQILPESQVIFNDDFGAMLCEVYDDSLTVKFITRAGIQIDYHSIPSTLITSVETEFNNLQNFSLDQNYPNPFNPSTKIKFTIPDSPLSFGEGQGVRLIVYDVLGNEITTLVDEYKPAGSYEVEFDASKLSTGIYFYTLKVGNFTETKKMTLIK